MNEQIYSWHGLFRKQNRNSLRTIICCIIKFREKQKPLKNVKLLKNSGIFVYEDFGKDTIELRKELGKKYWNIKGRIKSLI